MILTPNPNIMLDVHLDVELDKNLKYAAPFYQLCIDLMLCKLKCIGITNIVEYQLSASLSKKYMCYPLLGTGFMFKILLDSF